MGPGNYWYGVRGRDYASDSEYSFTGMTTVTPEFFETFEVSLTAGRAFDTRDAVGSELVVIVDERFAELNWPEEDPVGNQLRLGRSDSENPWLTVVGVSPTLKMAQATDYLHRAGSLDHELANTEIRRVALILTLPGVRQWWDAGARTQLTPQFVELMRQNASEKRWILGSAILVKDPFQVR